METRPAGTAGAGGLDCGRISGTAHEHFALERDARRARGFQEPFLHADVREHPSVLDLDGGARAQLHRHGGALGGVPREGHVHRQSQVRLRSVSGGDRSAQADLLLHGEDKGDVVRGRLQLPHDLDKNGAPHPVVHGLGNDALTHLLTGAEEATHVSHLDAALLSARSPDIDEELIQRRNLRAVLQLFQADHPDGPVGEPHPPSQEWKRADPAHAAEAKEPSLVHVRNHHADLIHVRRKHDAGVPAIPRAAHEEVPQGIDARFHPLPRQDARCLQLRRDELTHRGFPSGRTIALGQLPDDLLHVRPHFFKLSPRRGMASRTRARA